MCRHDAVTRLMTDDTRHMRRQTNRATDITTEFQWSKTTRERRGRTAGRTSWGAREIIRVIGGPENFIVALQVAGIDRQVSLAKNDCAGGTQTRDRPGILWRDEVRQLRRARRRPHSRRLEGILHGHRYAM